MLFALVAHDRPNRVALRMELRPTHIEYLKAYGDTLKLAGPFADEDGNLVGSIIVIEAESLDAARTAFARDPYMAANLFDQVSIKPWKLAINNTHSA
jgi:uncharacterized protein